MPLIQPLRALRPVVAHSSDVVAPPYDVVDRAEAQALVEDRPWSFLHVSRPEIDLDDSIDAYDDRVYAKGRENLDRMVAEGVLIVAALFLVIRPPISRIAPRATVSPISPLWLSGS